MFRMFVTALVSHAEIFWLNEEALLNIDPMFVTALVSHAEISWLNEKAV